MANFKTNAMRILDSAKVNYKVYTYESGGDFDGQSVARKIGVDENCVFKITMFLLCRLIVSLT